MQSVRSQRILGLLLLTFVALFIAVYAVQANAVNVAAQAERQTDTPDTPLGTDPDPSCRYGVAMGGADQESFVAVLGAGWYLNFGISAAPASNGAEFARVLIVRQDKNGTTYLPTYTATPPLTDGGLGSYVDSNPGALWIIGNEVERGPNPGDTNRVQGDTFPDVYADAYHDAYYFIKQRDPSALVAPSALVEVTPGRLQYLDNVHDSYVQKYGTQMPADVWNMHLYILPEVEPDGDPNGIASVALGTDPALGISESYDPDGGGPLGPADTCGLADVYCYAEHDSMQAFSEQVVRMRQWMLEHGYRNRPLLVSEYSLLYPYDDDGATCFIQDEYGDCFTPSRVQTFMTNTFNYLSTATDPNLGYPADNDRLVQQWLWYSVKNTGSQSGVGEVSNLVSNVSTGELSALGQLFRTSVENAPNYVNLYPAQVNSPYAFTNGAGTVTVTLTAEVGNNGSTTASTFDVTFYSDSGLNNAIGTVNVPAQSSSFPGMTGCATRNVSVSVPWENLGPGLRSFWVKVDSGNIIGEAPPGQDGEADNVMRGTVFVDPFRQSFLPITPRD